MRPHEVEDILPKFNPCDPSGLSAELWVKAVEDTMEEYDIDHKIVMVIVKKLFAGPALLWYDGLIKKESVRLGWKKIAREICSVFPAKTCSVDIHEMLRNKIRPKQQSFMEFYFEIVNIAAGKLNDEAIIKYVIYNINDAVLGGSLKAYKVNSLSELVNRIQYYEAMEGGTKQKSGVRDQDKPDMKFNGDFRQQSDIRRRKCYNCFEFGHIGVNCPKPLRKAKCEVCGKIGHEADRCYRKAENKDRKVFCVCEVKFQQENRAW